jgi:hypothetical protein
MAKSGLGSGWYGLEVGSRWRDASGSLRVVILGIRRSGVISYRREDASADEERVTNVIRFVEIFGPADSAFDAAYGSAASADSVRQA